MARAAYIIGYESSSVDRATGLPSYFHVFDSIEVVRGNEESGLSPVPHQKFTPKIGLTACWMREENDTESVVFEHQLVFHIPNADERVAAQSEFCFTTHSHRFEVQISMDSLIHRETISGLLRIESRIRKVGESIWHNQEFPIHLNVSQAN